MLRFIRKKLTKGGTEIPLFWVNFNSVHYHNVGEKNSCDLHVHPNLAMDEHIHNTLNSLVDYIRENYNMEDML